MDPSSIGNAHRALGPTALTLLAVLATMGHAAGSVGSGAFTFRPGVIVSADRSVCYLMNTNGGIDAVDLATGDARWTTTEAQKPLALVGDTLIAQSEVEGRSGVLRLVMLDVAGGGSREAEVDVGLPQDVQAAIDDGPGTRFRIDVRELEGDLIAEWSYSESPVRGGAEDEAEAHQVSGAFRIDSETWDVLPADAGEIPIVPLEPLPARLLDLEEAGRLPARLWPSDGVYAAAIRRREAGASRTVLKRWRVADGDSLPDVTLFTGSYTIRYPSADGRHLLVSRTDRTPPDVGGFDWLVFSLATGERVAELSMDTPGAWFFLTGPLLVHEFLPQFRAVDDEEIVEPGGLRAVDMGTGEERWARPVRDTAYHGPLPPRT